MLLRFTKDIQPSDHGSGEHIRDVRLCRNVMRSCTPKEDSFHADVYFSNALTLTACGVVAASTA